MKIAFIGTRGIPANYGGTETYVERISKYLASQGDEVVVYCKKSASQEEKAQADNLYPENLKRVELPSIPTKHFDNLTRSFLSTIHACMDKNIEIIQFNNIGPAFFSFIPKLFGKKVVGAIRAIDSQRDKWSSLAKAILRVCDYITVNIPHATTVNSLAMKEYYFNKYGKDTIYIPNGVELPEKQDSTNLIHQLGLESKKYILFAARLEPEKGCHTLINAYKKAITETNSDIKLAIAGNSRFASDYYNELIEQQNDNIKFLGYIEAAPLNGLYANAYSFILPSSVEGMSNSLLSAMIHGIPSAVSNIPENLALFDEAPFDESLKDKPGLSFELENSDDLANQLVYLINNPSEAIQRGKLLQAHAMKNFTLKTMYTNTRKVYSDLLLSNKIST